MRIQETEKVLKQARMARHHPEPESSALWTWLSGTAVALFAVIGVFVYLRNR